MDHLLTTMIQGILVALLGIVYFHHFHPENLFWVVQIYFQLNICKLHKPLAHLLLGNILAITTMGEVMNLFHYHSQAYFLENRCC